MNKTFALTALALAAYGAGASEYWTSGVSQNTGWHDYNKDFTYLGGSLVVFKPGESNLCWAASASNMLDWWQQHHAQQVPAQAPVGEGIWNEFKKSFIDDGLAQQAAIEWWFTGKAASESEEQKALEALLTHYGKNHAGNYYEYDEEQLASYLTRYNTSAHSHYLTRNLVQELKAGKSIGAGVCSTDGNISHAITIWGVDYDHTSGHITRIWITDSDDSEIVYTQDPVTGETTVKKGQPGLKVYDVEEQEITTSEGLRIKGLVLKNYYEGAVIYLEDISALSLTPHAPIEENEASFMSTRNGVQSLGLIAGLNETETAPEEIQALEESIARLLEAYDLAALEHIATAIAGTSIPTLGKAFSDDMNRQLRTMRNRVSQTTCEIPAEKRYQVWAEAENATSMLSAENDNTEAGYDLNSWGGSVGVSAALTPNLYAGISITALNGSFTAESNDDASGDLNTRYLGAFARFNSGNWEHSLIATAGQAEGKLTRTVHFPGGLSTNSGKTDGTGFGLMYETAYHFCNAETGTTISPVLNISLTHSSLDGYTEHGDSLALAPGATDMTALTIGTGARVQTEAGATVLNRNMLVHGRAMVNFHTGDRCAETAMKFANTPGSVKLRSAESGAVGLELGAGFIQPIGDGSSAIYADAAAEINSGYNAINATVGYRFCF